MIQTEEVLRWKTLHVLVDYKLQVLKTSCTCTFVSEPIPVIQSVFQLNSFEQHFVSTVSEFPRDVFRVEPCNSGGWGTRI